MPPTRRRSRGHAHVVVKPGWGLPIKGLQVQVLSAAGDLITKPLPGAGEANSYCKAAPAEAEDATENARSAGVLITYGKFRFLDLGDLTKKKEMELACPNNLIGTVDLFLVTHHGADLSNPKPLVWALHPRVAIFDNGPRKGASPAAWQIVHDSPGLEDLWQLHYAAESDKDHNVAEERIANVKENCEGKGIKVVGRNGRRVYGHERSDGRARRSIRSSGRTTIPPMIVIVMGVTGAGKTTVGRLLASELKWEFADADDFHPAANVEKMRRGIALGDDDRRPWLARLRAAIEHWIGSRKNVVLACSALKNSYRRELEVGPEVRFVYLKGNPELIADRLRAREGHFANEQILAGQFADLEEPQNAVTVEIASTPQQIVAEIRERLGLA